jgi:integrase
MPTLRKRDYLFKRDGSQYWNVRFQMNGKSVAKSLKTTDRLQAEVLAQPFITEHKRRLLEARPKLVSSYLHKLAPGREHAAPDGGRIVATDHELIYLNHSGAIERTESNRIPTTELINIPQGPLPVFHLGDPTQQLAALSKIGLHKVGPLIDISKLERETERPTVPTKNGDDAIFETYLKHKNVTGYFEREARHVWALYKTLTDGKALKDATRDDGRLLVAHFEEQGLKSASIRKKLMWLRAAVNLAIDEGKLKFNPFSSVAPKREDSLERLPLDDADMQEANRNLGKLRESDQLLFRLLASTGMRLSEAFGIASEQIEHGCRYVIVGKKTKQSKRRVPLPAAVLPFLPDTIKGRLFRGDAHSASKRLNAWLTDIGIIDERKVMHSLRHRAQDRLRAVGCPEDIRHELLGHEKQTVAKNYGAGHPVTKLREWIDKIGL